MLTDGCQAPRGRPRAWRRLLAVLWLFTCPFSGVAAEQAYHPSRLLIKPAPGRGAELARFRSGRGDRLLRRMARLENIEVVEIQPGVRVEEAVARYSQSGLCEFAEPDFRVRLALAPNDPRFTDGSLWHFHNTGQSGGLADADLDGPEAWDTITSAANVIVAVVDTGVRFTHEDLAPNMWVNPGEIPNNGVDDDQNGYIDDVHGINASNGSGNPTDLEGHGTQVAGFIGAKGNNARGVAGVAWDVKIMACRFYDDAAVGFISDAAEAITYARLHGANVVNTSFISTDFSSALHLAINQCRAAGVIVVAAAGNDTANTDLLPYYPAAFDLDNIVAVVATTRHDLLSSFSNYGALSTDLGAPGSSLYTTTRANDSSYSLNSGSSFSAPLVAGAFALMRARYPFETYRQLIERVFASVDPLPALQGRCSTGGRLNLARALGPNVAADFLPSQWAGQTPFTLQFTNTSFGSIVGWHWDFGDGTSSDLPNATHSYLHEGDYEVTLTVTGSNGTTNSRSAIVSALAGYQIEPAPYAWIDPSGMTALPLGNSGVSGPLSLPFPFLFHGRPYTNLFVSSEGLLGFDPADLTQAANSTLPNPAAPNNIICPFWDDLRPGTAGSVHFGTSGTAPDRRAVISWVGVRHGSFPPASFTFQVALEETSHGIRFQYQNVDAGNSNPGNQGGSATIGLEHASGHAATLYSFNGAVPVQNGQAILFRPGTSGGMTVWPATTLEITGDAGGPLAPAAWTYALNNTSLTPLSWRLSWVQPWFQASATEGTLAPGQSTELILSLSAAAHTLPPGHYLDSLRFENLTSGIGTVARVIRLQLGGTQSLLEISTISNAVELRLRGKPNTEYQLERTADFLTWIEHSIHRTDASGKAVVFDELSPGAQAYRARTSPEQ